MSAPVSKVAGQVGKAATQAATKAAKGAGSVGGEGGQALNKGAKRDPELYVCQWPCYREVSH